MKQDNTIKPKKGGINFWICGGLLVILMIAILGREIDRPFFGLHSWAKASGAWAARSHVKYGLDYTKGMTTWALGYPPKENPSRYLDHPQSAVLTLALFFKIFGVSEFSYRLFNLITTVLILIVFLKILKELFDDKIALLAGLIYVLFPLIGYFGGGSIITLMAFIAFLMYLGINDHIELSLNKRTQKIILAAALFIAVQFGWTGFFYAFGIGFHYVFFCLVKRKIPTPSVLAILIIAPLSSLLLNFIIMAGGYDWDISKIMELYKWRSAKGEMQQMVGFDWGAWLAKFWEFALINFTLPVLLLAIGYLTVGQFYVWSAPKDKTQPAKNFRFPFFLLFAVPPVTQVLVLRGALWKHQTWERPFSALIAISAALGLAVIFDLVSKANKKAAVSIVSILLLIIVVSSANGTNYYYDVRWQAPQKIQMFEYLKNVIPPDKHLLSFENFIVNQHKAKGGFIRPEIAWVLDREIDQAGFVVTNGSLDLAAAVNEIRQKAQTGLYPCYLMPIEDRNPQLSAYLSALRSELSKYYPIKEYFSGSPGKISKDKQFLRAGMYKYMVFDLQPQK